MQITKSTFYQVIVFNIFIIAFYLTIPEKDKWWATVLLLLLILVLVILEYMRTHYIVSPLLIWYVFWLGAISVGRMDLKLYPLYRIWETPLVRIILINTYIFFCFFGIGELSVKNTDDTSTSSLNSNNRLTGITLIMLSTALLSFALNSVRNGYIPLLTGDSNSVRAEFIRGKSYTIVSTLRVSFAMVPLALKREKNREKRILLIVLTIALLISEILSGWRSYAFQAMIFYLSSYFVISGKTDAKERRRNFRIVVLLAIFAIAFIGFIAIIRESLTGSIKEKFEYLIYTIYMYIAPNFINFQSAMENVEPVFAPIYSTRAIWGFFPNRYAIFSSVKDIDQAIGAFNVSTYLLHPWGDFGSIGTYIWSALIAFISGAANKKCRIRFGITSMVLLGIMNNTVFLMHNNFFLRSRSVLLWVAVSCVVQELCSIKKASKV